MYQEESNQWKQIATIPNLLSLGRIVLIPLFMWLYCVKHEPIWTAVVLLLSGLTDVADGFIARRYHMVSDFGKALDPIADKVTQGAMLLCLISRFPRMTYPFVLLLIKEAVIGITSLLAIRKTGKVESSDWHGKTTTVLLYGTMTLHLLWADIPAAMSDALIAACVLMMFISFILYGIRNIVALRSRKA